MRRRNVLVLPAGTEIGQEIANALKSCKEVRLFGAGQDVSNHAAFTFPVYHPVRSVHEEGWVDDLVQLCQTHRIDYIFPAHDDVIVALARNAARIPATIVSSPAETCEITRSKSATYRKLQGKVRVPNLFESSNAIPDFPVLVKPDRGQGSFGITLVRDRNELARALETVPDPIICEYLPGEEYTVDCFSDRERGVLFAGARVRRRTRNGISVNTQTVSLQGVKKIAQSISEALELRGAWFYQLKRAGDGELALLEVAPRIAGSMAAHRVLGVNFPLLSIFEAERLPLSVTMNSGHVELDRGLSNRYRHELKFGVVYVDLDDTLVLNGKVNTDVVTLIFQCIDCSIPVKLLTRHAGELPDILHKHRLSGLFDDIIHLRNKEPKSEKITESDAILIDDSYSERMEVHAKRSIPTFDCSMIELLTLQATSKPEEDQ